MGRSTGVPSAEVPNGYHVAGAIGAKYLNVARPEAAGTDEGEQMLRSSAALPVSSGHRNWPPITGATVLVVGGERGFEPLRFRQEGKLLNFRHA